MKELILIINLLIAGSFCSLQGVSQVDSSDFYIDTVNNKKKLHSFRKIEFGFSTHEYTPSYNTNNINTSQYEVASCIYLGYSHINDIIKLGIIGKKGVHHYFDQPDVMLQRPILSKPWIIELNGSINLFSFRKRSFFLGPMFNYTSLYDNKYQHANQIAGIGFYLRIKWFSFHVLFHKYLGTKNKNFEITKEKSLTRAIGILIPLYKVKEVLNK